MSFTLHVVDAIARDQRVLRATEEGVEVEYVSDASEDSYGGRRKKSSKPIDNREMVIHLFGASADGTPIRVEVNGFKPFFFIGLPDSSPMEASKNKEKIEASVKGKVKQFDQIEFTLVFKQKLYGYTGGKKYPFVKITVPSQGMFYELRKYFLDENTKPKFRLSPTSPPCPVFESNIDPMLRFFHIRNISPCGWIRVKGVELDSDMGDGLTKIQADWDSIDPCEAPPGRVVAPFKHAFWDVECYSHDGEFPVPTQGYRRVGKQLNQKAENPSECKQLLLEAFAGSGDIKIPPLKNPKFAPKLAEVEKALNGVEEEFKEAWQEKDRTSALTQILDKRLKRLAPIAGDPIIQIGTVKWKAGEAKGEQHIFVLGGCDPVPGAVVHTAKTEKELLLAWFQWVADENFDVFVGYNIFGFDEKYVWERLCELGLEQEEVVQQLTRLWDEGGEMKLQEKFLSSAALGDNTLYMWNTPGRLRIDLLGHVKRKSAMDSYKLDSVAAAFLSGKLSGIVKAEQPNHWLLKTKQKGDARIGRYVQVLDELGGDLSEKMAIKEVTDNGLLVESEEDLEAVAAEAVKWAVVKDDVPPKEIFRLHRGSNADRARVAAYCVQDCDLVLELYRKLDVFNEAMSMANVCSVPVSYIFTRGQGIKIESLIFKDCMNAGQLIEVLPQANRAEQEDSYEGAIVLDPVPGFYAEAPVGVCDFASLYPSTIISENISHDMLVWVKDYDMNGKLVCVKYGSDEAELHATNEVRFTDIEFDIWRPNPEDTRKNPEKLKAGIRVCRYAQPPGDKKGSLPTIVAKLLAARKAKRNEMAKTDDPFKKALLDAEQNAYKVTANSLYGQLGSGTFKIRLQHLAASVTSYGRKQILFAKEAIETFYGPEAKDPRCSATIVYGDTDSIFVNFNPRNPDTGERYEGREAIVKTIELTEEAGKFVTGALKAPHDFEYDKVFYPFIIFSKKRYVGNKYEDSPDEFKQTSMGIVLKRRDNAPLLKMSYSGAIDKLLNHRDINGAVDCVKEKVRELVDGKMKLSQLTITKSLRADYKVAPPAHKMLADRITKRDPGNAPASGERIGFVYIKAATGQQASKLQGDRIETPAYIIEKGLKADAEYYIDHQLYNPLSQLFGIMVEKMPGYIAPRSWAENPDKLIAQREILAGDLLFKEALQACKQQSTKSFMKEMFGATATEEKEKVVKNTKTNTTVTAAPQMKQTTLSNFFRDTAIIDDSRLAREMRSVKRAAKQAKEASTKTTQTATDK